MGEAARALELFSFHSTSKGLLGECGKRGGYMELHGIDKYVQGQIFKLASSGLCAAVTGQALTALMVKPPQPGDPSYPLFALETSRIRESLASKARLLVAGLNSIEGFSCNEAKGAMYAFPAVRLPERAVAEARSQGQEVSLLSRQRRHAAPPRLRSRCVPLRSRVAGAQPPLPLPFAPLAATPFSLLPPAGRAVRRLAARIDGHLRRARLRLRAGARPLRLPHDLPARERAARAGC